MPERNIKITLAYDGTDFCGWQIQDSDRTVQSVVEEALEHMHGHPVRIHGAGRTDSGVHASGQVVSFFTDLDSIPAERYRDALNANLPADVRALYSSEVDPSFHARTSAVLRIYAYYLYSGAVVLPHLRRSCWRIRNRPSVATLNRMAAQLAGLQDYSTFSAAGDSSQSKIRRIDSAGFYPQGGFLVFRVAASSFLWKMVRSIVGTMIDLELKGEGESAFAAILGSRDRSRAGPTAPPRGLFLERVVYGDEFSPC